MSDYYENSGTQRPELEEFPGWNEPVPVQQNPAPEKPKKSGKGLIAVALCCSLLGSMLGAGGVLLAEHLLHRPALQEQAGDDREADDDDDENVLAVLQGLRKETQLETVYVDTGKLMTPAEVYAANVNSTVGITTSITTNYWGYQTTSAAAGSGFILTQDGYILTNYHVVENSDSITVSLYDGTTYDAALVGWDTSLDTAILKVEAEGLTPVILGDSDRINVGDEVVAIGNPLGELTFSLTGGAISAKDREITLSRSRSMALLQTDCAINSGNSGGALFNLYGEVIGITNAKYSSSSSGASIDNIGFAIPINNVMDIVESILEKGYISKPYIGISVTNVSAEAQAYGIPVGAAVYTVVEGSAAEKGGLQVGDVVTEANGQEIASGSELVNFIGRMKPGDTLVLQVFRQGQLLEIKLEVAEKIQSATDKSAQEQQSQQQQIPSWVPDFG